LALLLTACDQAPPQVIVQIKEVPVEVAAIPEGPDGCKVNTTSNLVTEHTVSPIKNLIKVKGKDGPGTCVLWSLKLILMAKLTN